MAKTSKPLSFKLTADQIKTLQPILEQAGKVDILGSIEEGELKVGLLACNMHFTPDLTIKK